MSNIVKHNKLLFAVMAVMTFLPMNNLFADEWNAYYDSWEYETDDMEQTDYSHYYKQIDTEASYYDDPYASGIDISGFAYAYTEADVSSNGNEYSNSFYLLAEAEVGCYKDFVWDGPPGEAYGADIDGDLYAGYSYPVGQSSTVGRSPSEIEAITEASADSGTWAEAVGYDSNGDDMCTVGAETEAELDNSSSYLSYYYISEEPDSNSWSPSINPDFYYSGTLTWSYSSSFDYEVSPGLTWFSVEALTYGYASSYVSIDADISEYDEDTFSISEAYIELDSIIDVYLN